MIFYRKISQIFIIFVRNLCGTKFNVDENFR